MQDTDAPEGMAEVTAADRDSAKVRTCLACRLASVAALFASFCFCAFAVLAADLALRRSLSSLAMSSCVRLLCEPRGVVVPDCPPRGVVAPDCPPATLQLQTCFPTRILSELSGEWHYGYMRRADSYMSILQRCRCNTEGLEI